MRPLELNIDGQPSLRGRTMKTYLRGTHRMIPPAETLARLKPLVPEMGITRLANVTGLDIIGIPVVIMFNLFAGITLTPQDEADIVAFLTPL